MKVSQLIKQAGITPSSCVIAAADPVIEDIAYDSRTVKAGDLFVAIAGLRDNGDIYIKDALEKGAVAVLSENPQPGCAVTWVQVDDSRAALGMLANALWSIDQKSMLNVGITGTNGKTTTSYFYKKLMDQLFGEDCSWMFGTVQSVLGTEVSDSTHTTPEALDLLRLVNRAAIPPRSMVMEVSSHALSLKRVAGIQYDLAVWTNLTLDHLDFHGDMQQYYKAKKLLFTEHMKQCGVAVVNIDDPWGKRLSEELANTTNVVTYGKDDAAMVKIISSNCDWNGCLVGVEYQQEKSEFHSPLKGHFNVYNMVAMIAGAFALNIDRKKIQDAFSEMNRVPGRMDRVPVDAPFVVIVDYAHTPDALVNVLQAARPLTSGELICVFGCGGDRDKSKRAIMGESVALNCDEAIVTSDNPRSEKPESIIAQIVQGIPLDFPHTVITNRRDAIEGAIRRAKSGDCIVVAGKGHEEYQEMLGVRSHFSDTETVQEIYKELKG